MAIGWATWWAPHLNKFQVLTPFIVGVKYPQLPIHFRPFIRGPHVTVTPLGPPISTQLFH